MNEFSYKSQDFYQFLVRRNVQASEEICFPCSVYAVEGLCGGSQHHTAKALSTERWVHHTVRPWPDCLGGCREICGREAGRKHWPFVVCSSSFVPRHNTRQITNLFPSFSLNQAQLWFRQLVAITTSKFQTFLCFSSMIPLSRKYRYRPVVMNYLFLQTFRPEFEFRFHIMWRVNGLSPR